MGQLYHVHNFSVGSHKPSTNRTGSIVLPRWLLNILRTQFDDVLLFICCFYPACFFYSFSCYMLDKLSHLKPKKRHWTLLSRVENIALSLKCFIMLVSLWRQKTIFLQFVFKVYWSNNASMSLSHFLKSFYHTDIIGIVQNFYM